MTKEWFIDPERDPDECICKAINELHEVENERPIKQVDNDRQRDKLVRRSESMQHGKTD